MEPINKKNDANKINKNLMSTFVYFKTNYMQWKLKHKGSQLCASVFLGFFVFSFSFNNLSYINKDELNAIWVYSNIINEKITYIKSDSFITNKPGIQFKKNGKLIIRQNPNWCATEPIGYSNYKGSWKLITDSTISINYKYLNGKIEEKWVIIKVDLDSLVIIENNLLNNFND